MMFKKNDKVVKIIIGGGVETASIKVVQAVDKKKGLVFLDSDDRDPEGVQTYRDSDGRAAADYIPGFTSRLIVLEE